MKERKHCTVLIVDDSPEDRTIFSSYLQQSMNCIYTVLEAEDLQTGLRLCRQVRIDCVLLDYELPDGCGLDFLNSVRDGTTDVTLPVVMITGHGNEHAAVNAMKAGAIDYLVKDEVTPESLFGVTQNALERLNTLNSLASQTRERARVETELRDSETHFRLLVSSVSEYAIVMLGLDGTITTWNQGARNIFGYHDHDIIGQHVSCLYTPNAVQLNEPQQHLDQATAQQRFESEHLLIRRDRSEFHAVSVIAPLVDPMGRHRGFSWVVRDLTVRDDTRMALTQATRAGNEVMHKASDALRTSADALKLKLEELKRELHASEVQHPTWLEGRLQAVEHLANTLAQRVNNLMPVDTEPSEPQDLNHGK